MTTALSAITRLVGGFLGWWLGELTALIPAAVRERLHGSGERLLLEMRPEGEAFYRLRGRKAVPLDAEAASSCKANTAIALALPSSDVVTRPTQLPLAAEENLHEVVGFEMDRLTPFSRDEVYYACRVTGRDAKAGRLLVDVLLAPRRRIDALLAVLKDRGVRIGSVDVASVTPGKPLGVNLLPEAARPAPSRLGRILGGALTATAVVLLVIGLQIPLQRKADHAAALEARVAEERARLAVLRTLEKEIAALSVRDTSVQDLKRESILALALLEQVTRLLPDDAWLNQLSLSGDRLDVAGFSPNSSKLITTFEQSPDFAEAAFRAPVTQDPRLGLERFSLSMRVAPEAGR